MKGQEHALEQALPFLKGGYNAYEIYNALSYDLEGMPASVDRFRLRAEFRSDKKLGNQHRHVHTCRAVVQSSGA
jgi:hypothetical protein